MALLIAGAFMVALGLFAGGVLVAAPLGLITGSVDATLWVLFPLLSILGFVLFVIGAKTAQIRGLSQFIAWALLALALASAAGLVLRAASLVVGETSTLPLWYVLVIAGFLGAVGAASASRGLDSPA
ncbi:hypothetical protein [Piscinibacter sp. HJYY11]|uniref:hypothetical protein n=1 Tax=Piscinibacter sp. HJYY11 TaxID=2801333 RepID=UPI00191E4898|nr:hypothetical protein [Piscinibacter sp. HJYY11]MBL0728241.1 hypothetical protein [Piscinibacter sp. HJYY11]